DFPDIVPPLPCLLPLASGGLKSAIPMKLAGAIYNLIAKHERSSIPVARVVGSSFVREHLPALEPLCTSGAFLWHDALLLSPAALIEAVSSKASACGARLFEHSRVSAVARDGKLFRVSIAKDGSKEAVQAKVVVDASGPWLESLLDRSVPANVPLAAGWCRAFNVILTKQLEPRYAVGLHSPRKRLFFAVPRESETVLGTAYFAHQGDPETAKINAREIEDFIVDFQATWPQAAVTLNDVKSVEFGVLPMQHVDPYGPVLYGRERILDRQGYVSVMSTKYTTFREQARAVLKMSVKYLR
ncbi:MAG: FAD-dependent oxidoreductase, partial [Deltaproteobacteria bacterium]|nr:FAD-dependent oxidoreductase [Deltaproteobacteria bacterium]